MPNYFPQQSPWLGAASSANDTGSRLLVQMAVLRAQNEARMAQRQQQDSQFQQTLGLHREQLDATKAVNAAHGALYEKQGAAADALTASRNQSAGRAADAQGAAFGQAMLGTPGYDPFKTSYLPSTPDMQSQILTALGAGAQAGQVASSPTATASLLKPQPGFNLSKGAKRFDPSGKLVAENPDAGGSNDVMKQILQLSLLGQRSDAQAKNEVSALDSQGETVVNNGQVSPTYQMNTNNAGMANQQLNALLSQYLKTNAPAMSQSQAAPTRTATNPQTGQKIGLVNGQWIPL